jgi:CBS domain-containing protein
LIGSVSVDFQLSLHRDTVSSANPDGPLATAAEASIASVMQLLKMQRNGAALVYEGDKLAGIFTERDALKLMRQRADLSRPVREVMSKSPVTISPSSTVGDAIQQMSSGGYRSLPIVDEKGQATGVVAVRGIVHYLVEHFPATIYNLPPKPETAPAQREGA